VPARRLLPLVAAALAAALAGCGGGDDDRSDRVRVVATTAQMADIARNVGGDAVDVHPLLPAAGGDPHGHEPRPRDIEAIARAELIVLSGAGLDEWAREVIDSSGTDATVVDAGAGRPAVRRTAAGDIDPHWWHDPRNVAHAAGRIGAALADAAEDPGARRRIERNAAAYAQRVRALDRAIAGCLQRIPAGRRRLVTQHDSIGHLADRYDLEVVGTISPAQAAEAQPSAGELAALADRVRRERVAAIFPDAAGSDRLARALARQTGARVGPALYGDSLGRPGSPEATYLGMEAANAERLAHGLTDGRVRCAIRP